MGIIGRTIKMMNKKQISAKEKGARHILGGRQKHQTGSEMFRSRVPRGQVSLIS